jgi:hypothetical protein
MGFLDFDVNDVTEPTAVPADQEYKLRIVDVTQSTDKNGNPYLLPRFEVVGEPAAKDFTRFLRLPHGGQTAKQLNQTKWALKTFFDAFGVSPESLEAPEDMIGSEGWAILGAEETPEWGEQNFIKKFIVGK